MDGFLEKVLKEYRSTIPTQAPRIETSEPN